MTLKLVRTLLNYRILRTSTSVIFLSNGHSLYTPLYFGLKSSLISFAWDQSTCQVRVESDKIQNEKCLPTVGFEPTTLFGLLYVSITLFQWVVKFIILWRCVKRHFSKRMYNVRWKTYVKRTFYNLRLTHVLHTVNVRCNFCCERLF